VAIVMLTTVAGGVATHDPAGGVVAGVILSVLHVRARGSPATPT
jgi:hypothetical protein